MEKRMRGGQQIPMRQIHLDFHNSELIENVAEDFDAEAFSDTLRRAHVDSVTLFSRCHHGMLYYDSRRFPERVHPQLQVRDLLKRQAESCRRKGLRVNLYTSVRWDVYTVKQHQEWVCIDENGALSDYEGKGYFEAGFYKNLCLNTGYRDWLKEQLQEVMEEIPADGVWFDASFVVECCCPICMKKMRERGLDPSVKEDRERFSLETYRDFVQDMSAFVRSRHPDYTVFYNKGHVGRPDRPVKDSFSYLAMESLPGGPWDYLDFPHSQRYLRNWGLPTLGLTGRFHTSWGDFHSFRDQTALEYECFRMLAMGAGCNIGDQLEPSGRLSAPIYEQIGKVYGAVEQKEPWCIGTVPVSEIGVFTPEEFYGAGTGRLPKASQGVCRLLQEHGYQFEFLDTQMSFDGMKLLILPDVIPVDREFAVRLDTFLEEGGRLLLTGESGLTPAGAEAGERSSASSAPVGRRFASDKWGVRYLGEAPYEPDFLVPQGKLGAGLPETEHVMYLRGCRVEPAGDGEILSTVHRPVFNRTWEHFSSHMHAPSAGEPVYPGIVGTGETLYFAHPLFTIYQLYHPGWVRDLLLNALRLLLPEPVLEHDGPTTLEADLNLQEQQSRYALHLLHYIPEHRSELVDTVEDVIPLYGVNIILRTARSIRAVTLVPENRPLPFTQQENTLRFTVPEIRGHRMLELTYR